MVKKNWRIILTWRFLGHVSFIKCIENGHEIPLGMNVFVDGIFLFLLESDVTLNHKVAHLFFWSDNKPFTTWEQAQLVALAEDIFDRQV